MALFFPTHFKERARLCKKASEAQYPQSLALETKTKWVEVVYRGVNSSDSCVSCHSEQLNFFSKSDQVRTQDTTELDPRDDPRDAPTSARTTTVQYGRRCCKLQYGRYTSGAICCKLWEPCLGANYGI